MVYNELSIDELLNQSIVSQDISIDAGASWEEYGLSYGRQVFDNGKHFISSAATLKITRGRSAAYLYSDNLDVTFPSDSMISISNSDIRFGYADLFSNIDAFEPSWISKRILFLQKWCERRDGFGICIRMAT